MNKNDEFTDNSDKNQLFSEMISKLNELTFKISERTYAGKVYDSSNKPHDTELHKVISSNEETFHAYCADITKLIDYNATYKIATNQEIESLFPIEYLKRLRWIINNTYPLITDLDYFDTITGSSNITIAEVVSATLAAIWMNTNSLIFQMGGQGADNNSNVIFMYNYLINGCTPGLTREDVINIGNNITLEFDLSNVEQIAMRNEYKYGPITLKASSVLAKNTEYELKEANNKVKFYDEGGNEITLIKVNTPFYIVASKYSNLNNLKILASGKIKYGADFHILMCENGKEASQSCGIYEDLIKDIEAFANIYLSKLIIRKIGNNDLCNFLPNAILELLSFDKKSYQIGTTDEVGIIYFYNLLPGKYYIKEIKAPDGYIPIESLLQVLVKSPYTIFNVNNDKKRCKIKIKKYDRNNQDIALEGAKFNVYKEKKLVDCIYTNKNGIGFSIPLLDGEYKIIEIKSPAGYKIDSDPIYINLTADANCNEDCKTIHICNKKYEGCNKGVIKIIKVDCCDMNLCLEGAKFQIRNQDCEQIEIISTDCRGEAVSKELEFGCYTITEIIAPDGYALDNEAIMVEVDRKEVKIVIRNVKKHRKTRNVSE